MQPELMRPAIELARAFASPLIDTIIKPKVQKMYENKQLDKALYEHTFENKFEEYLIRSFEKSSYMSTIVFPNKKKRIEELYLPLTINTRDVHGDEIDYRIEDDVDFIKDYGKKRTLKPNTYLSNISNSMQYCPAIFSSYDFSLASKISVVIVVFQIFHIRLNVS